MTRCAALVAAAVTLVAASPAMAQSASNGDTLYHTYCVSCHGDPPAAGPDRATSGAFIANTIRTNGSMQFLRTPNDSSNPFSDARITASTNDIYAWLQSRTNTPPPPPPPPPPVTADAPGPLSGIFYDTSESGWGMALAQRGNNVFAAWYTYDSAGNPKWYTALCPMSSGTNGVTGTCNGDLFEVSGPRFFGVLFDSRLVMPVAAGNIKFSFQNADNASMTYTVGTQTRTVPITRLPLGTGTTPPAVNYTDMWWNSDESGWGVSLTHQFDKIFLAWYVYDNNGRPTWYAALCTLSGGVCTGDALRTTGPPFGPTFDPTRVIVSTAGSVTVTFLDPNTAALNFTINGVTGNKNIKRFVF